MSNRKLHVGSNIIVAYSRARYRPAWCAGLRMPAFPVLLLTPYFTLWYHTGEVKPQALHIYLNPRPRGVYFTNMYASQKPAPYQDEREAPLPDQG